MTEISQFHKLARLVKRMDKEVSISSDAIVALSEEIAEAKALADYFRGRCYHWKQITKKWRRECKDAEALATSRLISLNTWKKVAKKWRYFGIIAIKDLEDGGQSYYYRKWVNEKALAADRLEMNKELEAAALKVLRTSINRLELLKRCKSVIDVCGVDWKHSTSRLDPALFDELEEELG